MCIHAQAASQTILPNDEHALEIVRDIVATLNRQTKLSVWSSLRKNRCMTPRNFMAFCRAVFVRVMTCAKSFADCGRFRIPRFKARYGTTLVCGFARFHGYPLGSWQTTASCSVKRAQGHTLYRVVRSAASPLSFCKTSRVLWSVNNTRQADRQGRCETRQRR